MTEQDMKRLGVIVVLILLSGQVRGQTDSETLDLVLVTIKSIPFSLLFRDGTNVVVGMKKNGFVVTAVTSNEIALVRGKRAFVLPRARRVPFNQYEVELMNRTDGTRCVVQSGEEFRIGTRALRVQEVDGRGTVCILRDVRSGRQLTVRPMVELPTGQAPQSQVRTDEVQQPDGGDGKLAPQP